MHLFFIVFCLLSAFADVLIIHNQHETAALSIFLMWWTVKNIVAVMAGFSDRIVPKMLAGETSRWSLAALLFISGTGLCRERIV